MRSLKSFYIDIRGGTNDGFITISELSLKYFNYNKTKKWATKKAAHLNNFFLS